MSGSYVRVYYSIIDDPKFADVYNDDAALATWLRLLLAADAMFPAPAPLPRRLSRHALGMLLAKGLVSQTENGHYRIKGLEAERERRAASARVGGIANAQRLHSERSPNGIPRRDETSKDKHGASLFVIKQCPVDPDHGLIYADGKTWCGKCNKVLA